MPKTLGVIALLVAVFLVALGGAAAGSALAGSGEHGGSSNLGHDGADGGDGADGRDGSDGTDGRVGPAGPRGIQGAGGQAGAQGVPGAAGSRGLTGPQGPPGDPGAAGAPGAPGQDGADGADATSITRFDAASLYGVPPTSTKIATLNAPFEAGTWVIEVIWMNRSGTGECKLLSTGDPNSPIPEARLVVLKKNLGPTDSLGLECINTGAGGFSVDATLRATKVTH